MGEKSYLAAPRNYAFMLNVDWFQPFKQSVYSVGVFYMVLMNLTRAERFKPENVFLVGVIPGRVRYIMLKNSIIMLLSVTQKNLVLCPKLCSIKGLL